MPGAYLGATLTGRLDEQPLLRAIAVVLVVTGLAMLAAGDRGLTPGNLTR